MATRINPGAHELGRVNAVLSARGTRRYRSRFEGVLSVKSVISGRATWETAEGKYELVPGCALVLNDGEEYEITAEALHPVETFCLFFERGFVEDAFRATMTSSAELLDAPHETKPLAIHERLRFDAPLVNLLTTAHARMKRGEPIDETFDDAALALARSQRDLASRVASLPSLRASTRGELARRLGAATSYLHANSDRAVTMADAARAACLSPFHFHRLFTSFHGITPHRYLTRLRLERARTLLRQQSIGEVAFSCGFESVGSFTTLFKRTFGITPGALQRMDRASESPS